MAFLKRKRKVGFVYVQQRTAESTVARDGTKADSAGGRRQQFVADCYADSTFITDHHEAESTAGLDGRFVSLLYLSLLSW